MAKPIKSLELHYPMIQFLINIYIYIYIYILVYKNSALSIYRVYIYLLLVHQKGDDKYAIGGNCSVNSA